MENKKSPFWDKKTTFIIIIAIGTPICFILLNLISLLKILDYQFNAGLDIGNSIALLAAGAAITSTLYSNYRSDIRNQDQIKKADKRLDKQLKKQDDHLNKQLSKQEEHLNKQLSKQEERLQIQLVSAKENLKVQLLHNEKQLKKQLIFNKERSVMLEVYKILYMNKSSLINNIESITKDDYFSRDKWNTELNNVINARKKIFGDLKQIRDDIHQLYYIPRDIQKKIIEFIGYILENQERIGYSPDLNRKLYYDDEDHLTEKYLKEIGESVEDYLGIKIYR